MKLSVYQIYSKIIEGPAFPAPLVQSSVYWTWSIINLEIFSFCAAYAVVGLLDTFYNHLRDEFLLHRLCDFSSTGYGLQSSKGLVPLAPLVPSSVDQIQSTTSIGYVSSALPAQL